MNDSEIVRELYLHETTNYIPKVNLNNVKETVLKVHHFKLSVNLFATQEHYVEPYTTGSN